MRRRPWGDLTLAVVAAAVLAVVLWLRPPTGLEVTDQGLTRNGQLILVPRESSILSTLWQLGWPGEIECGDEYGEFFCRCSYPRLGLEVHHGEFYEVTGFSSTRTGFPG